MYTWIIEIWYSIWSDFKHFKYFKDSKLNWHLAIFTINIYLHEIYFFSFFLSFALNLECYALRGGLWTLHTHVRKKRKANEPGFWTFLPRSYTFSLANVRSRFDGILSFFFCALVTSSVPYLIFNILLPLNFFQSYPYMWICSK